MFYTEEQVVHLTSEQHKVLSELQNLFLQCVVQGQSVADTRVQEYMLHGAARRVGILKRSVENVFTLFPPSIKNPIPLNVRFDVQINLHAFVINLYGVFDNWAWAFVRRHNLETAVGSRKNVGLFNNTTARYLPPVLKDYLASAITTEWYEKYLKNYRDALAHRIPLYVPPAEFTGNDTERYSKLELEKIECIKSMKWKRLDEVWLEQEAIGTPCFSFIHSYSEDDLSRPVLIHPQLLSDSGAVAEFGTLFLKHWHNRV